MHPSTLHVLIVDDSSEDRVALRRFLSQDAPNGYTVLEADRGEQALTICRATPPDCVLLDYRLPDRDGLAVLAALRTFTDVPVVLLTGVGHEALAVEAFRHGAQDYLPKGGWSPEQLHLSIHRAVATVQVARERDQALARLDALVSSAPSGISYLDRELRYVLINPTLAALNGQPPEAHLGRTLAEMLPGLAPRLEPLARQVLATGTAVRDIELRGRPCPHDNVEHDWLLSFYPVRGPNGGSDGVGVTVVDISEPRRTERALRASEARYQAMFEQNAAIQLLIEPGSGVIVDANPAAIRFYGYPRETLLSMAISAINQLTPAQVRAEMEAASRELRNHFHFPHRLASGEVRAVEVFSSPIEVEGRQLLYSIIHDETERVGAEQALRASQQNLAGLIENTDGSIWSVDTQYRLIVGNRRFHHHVGASLDRAVRAGESLVGLPLPQEILDDWRAWYDRALGGATFSVEVSSHFASEPRIEEYRFSPIRTAEGTITGVTVVSRDITAQKQAEVTISRLAERLALATRAAGIGVWDWDIAQNVLIWDDRMYALYGVRRENFVGAYEAWLHGLHPDDRAASDTVSAQARRGERPYDTEFRVVWPDGSVHVLKAAGEVIRNADGTPQRMIGVNYDITERVRAEQALATERALLARRVEERTADLSLANAELARAARLKDEFLASMSHELRTPLNAILGRAEVLQEGIYGPVTPQQITALHGVEESSRHLLALINDILDLSKIEAGGLELAAELVDVDLLCTMSLRMVAQGALAKHITVAYDHDSQVQWLQGDERRLKQILVNLLANAVKFTPEGGQVGLKIRSHPEDLTITFTVWDTGIGIAAEDRPRLFQPFVQIDSSLSRQYTGTGLGLSLVARLTRAHGGSVAVDSAPGQGSRFHVTLPWSPTGGASRPTPTTAVVETQRPAIHQALVIEDSPVAAAQITRYLRELGAQVEVLPHGTGTIERAIALQPDVIILDILLPDDDGWAVLRRLKADPRTQTIPVLVISVVDQPEQAGQLGAAALLVKPIDRAILEQTLRRVLRRADAPPVQIALVITPALPRPTILLAEDHEPNIAATADYLRAKGYDVRVARNGSEAIMRAQEERPDVILMDIQMPGMDGLEAMRRIRAAAGLGQVPIIALTALAMPGDRERCLEAGATAYLTKPVNLRSLEAMIRAHLQPDGA